MLPFLKNQQVTVVVRRPEESAASSDPMARVEARKRAIRSGAEQLINAVQLRDTETVVEVLEALFTMFGDGGDEDVSEHAAISPAEE